MDGQRKTSLPATNWALLRKKSLGTQTRIMKGKFLCIVTGAANGFGRAISSTVFQDNGIFPQAMAGSRVVLIDHDEKGLGETTGKKMRQFLKHRKIEVELITADLSNLEETKNTFEKLISKLDKDFEHVLFINHASSLADVSRDLSDLTEVTDIEVFWKLNLTSRIFITTTVNNAFSFTKRTVVVIGNTDLSKSTPYLGLNNIASSAIRAFSETFAKENENVRVIHYTHGRTDSNKTKAILDKCANQSLREEIEGDMELNKLITSESAARRLIKVLEEEEASKKGEIEAVSDAV